MIYTTLRQFHKMLGQLDKWLEAAEANAKARSFDPNVLLGAYLAPDQFPFVRQVQSSCDVAKLAASRLSGKPAPQHPDTEATIEDLRARVRSTVAFLDGFSAADFEAAATVKVSHPRWEGRWMTGTDYFVQHAVPNFFFHLTTAYALLRHNGVPIGKMDYLGTLTLHAPS